MTGPASIGDEAQRWLQVHLWGTCPSGHPRDARYRRGRAGTVVAEICCPTCTAERRRPGRPAGVEDPGRGGG